MITSSVRHSCRHIVGGWVPVLVAAASLAAADPVPAVRKFGDATPLEWSQRMARAEMARRGPRAKGTRWEYTSGLLAYALVELGRAVPDEAIRQYGELIVSQCIGADGSIRGYRMKDFNIDLIPPGRVALGLYERTKEERYRKAVETLRGQLARQPRTSEGGFWHKQRYPQQMWLDGLYMGSPFYAQYAQAFKEPAALDDVVKQIVLVDAHTFDAKTGLYYHAWDEARAQSWANKQTGTSPNFWGRAIGWYAMAIVDVLDFVPASHPEVDAVVEVLRRVASGIVRWQDPQTGLWWQIVDQGGREGNYREASASSMYVYALAKAVNRGYLPRADYLPVIRRGYEGIVRDLVKTGADGRVNLTQCCEVAGLGYTNSAGRPRDGTYAYYLSEPVVSNDPKGVGPFILAGLEVEQLLANDIPAPGGASVVTGWEAVPGILARLKMPGFPDRPFPILEFGAVADGTTDCTEAIRLAIEACHAAGGGRVVVPAGVFLTGAIHLKSNVNLTLAEGATLKFSTDPAQYPLVYSRWEGVECMNYSPLIYAFEQENIAVTGQGTLDGSASSDNWWKWTKRGAGQDRASRDRLFDMGERGVPVAERVFGDGHFLRPSFIQPYRCRNVLIEGVRIRNSPMWELNPVLCTNVTVRGVDIVSAGPNNDGCNPESCRDVLIEDCQFTTGDDCIAIKSGRNNDGRRVNVPSENLIIRRCTMRDGHGGVVIGSEISGGCRNVFVEDCVMDSPNLDRALRFKSNARRGGTIENVFMRNVQIGRVAEAVLTVDLLYEEGAKGSFPPTVRNVTVEHVTSSASPRVMYIRGFPGATIDNLRFVDCTFRGVEMTEVLNGAGTIIFRNVTIEPAKRTRVLNSVNEPAAAPVPAPPAQP
jgi:unsaturated rhamnogalacturonyl hydrolase